MDSELERLDQQIEEALEKRHDASRWSFEVFCHFEDELNALRAQRAQLVSKESTITDC